MQQEAHGPRCFAEMMACHKRSSYYASLVQTENSYFKSNLLPLAVNSFEFNFPKTKLINTQVYQNKTCNLCPTNLE